MYMPLIYIYVQYIETYTLFRVQRLFCDNLTCTNAMSNPVPVFLNVYGAQESIPRNQFLQPDGPSRVVVPARQAGNRLLGSLKVDKYGLWPPRGDWPKKGSYAGLGQLKA